MTQPLVQIVKGELDAEELAALTAVLMVRAAAAAEPRFAHGHRHARPQVRWRRLERTAGYRSPVSWR
ncbi:acyl-CoA carboxylase subunit epsilon [Streptacidiphilus monticola]|uniref:Acyl-CoA carboxylase subunit epsilon n=1 Tax=Streptacidiphilus monticola TaxID=2161674 RepID=A0ABW1FVQ5_9ACTN